jgi:hypothetical protein
MKQHNQIGKYTRKDEVLNAKVGKTFITPQNREYSFDYRKEGRKYIFIILYMGKRWQILESEFNRSNIDDLLQGIEKTIKESETL